MGQLHSSAGAWQDTVLHQLWVPVPQGTRCPVLVALPLPQPGPWESNSRLRIPSIRWSRPQCSSAKAVSTASCWPELSDPVMD